MGCWPIVVTLLANPSTKMAASKGTWFNKKYMSSSGKQEIYTNGMYVSFVRLKNCMCCYFVANLSSKMAASRVSRFNIGPYGKYIQMFSLREPLTRRRATHKSTYAKLSIDILFVIVPIKSHSTISINSLEISINI